MSVNIEVRDGAWVVVIVEANGRLIEQDFPRANYADSFAAGQRVRLGLPQVQENYALAAA